MTCHIMLLEYHELLEVCDTVSLEFTAEMSQLVEKETRSQAKSTLRLKFRAGRVTASCMKSVPTLLTMRRVW